MNVTPLTRICNGCDAILNDDAPDNAAGYCAECMKATMEHPENSNVQWKAEEIETVLPQFIGTTEWYRYSPQLFPRVLLTEGTKYIADSCQAYWLMDALSSYTPRIARHNQTFAVALLTMNGEDAATLDITDDIPANFVYAKQKIEYTDFPLPRGIKLFIARNGEDWVIMLPSEY